MKRFLLSLIAGVTKFGKRRWCSPGGRRVRLHLETMEQRLVPSSAPMHLPPAPAMTGQLVQQQVSVHMEELGHAGGGAFGNYTESWSTQTFVLRQWLSQGGNGGRKHKGDD